MFMRRFANTRGCVSLLAMVAVAALGVGPQPVHADPITTLFSTGVDGSGNLLADGAIDPHYTLPGNTFTIGNPAGVGWTGNTATSQWISPAQNTLGGQGPFTYTTTFDLTGFDPSTAQISGMWSSDNEAQMFLNGNLVAIDPYPGWTGMVPFSISSFFVSGINTLTFVVPNGAQGAEGPTGLQVQIESATADLVPEPASLAVFGLMGLAGALVAARRRRTA